MHEWTTVDMPEIWWTQNIGEANQNSALDKKYTQARDDRVTRSPSRTKATHTRARVRTNGTHGKRECLNTS